MNTIFYTKVARRSIKIYWRKLAKKENFDFVQSTKISWMSQVAEEQFTKLKLAALKALGK
ncbi:MAG: hypothetical protein ABI666_02320 [Ferruginibacter sp.]